MRRVPRFVWTLLACLITGIAVFAAMLLTQSNSASSDKYKEIIRIIQSNYYETRDVTSLEDASARSMINSLDDPWSYYLTPEEYAEYLLSETNQYIGVGITTEYSEKYGFLSITSVTPGSPADLAHIKVGNLVEAIDDTNVSQFTPEELAELIRSYDNKEEEADKTFTIHLRNSQGGKAEAKLKCELIYTEPVIYSVLDGTLIGYLKISNFDDSSAASLKTALSALDDLGVKSLILDVRDNTNGKPAELADALDYLLPKGDMFLLRDQNGKETAYSSGNSCIKLPMVVLINENTACAAEMFAYVMQEMGGFKVVGKKTESGAQSQVIVELDDGSAVRISKYEYLTPDKKSLLDLGGVTPDISSFQIEDSTMDVQLEAAKDAAS